jgi:hypothetical protein
MLNKRALFVVSALLPACLGSVVALSPEAASVTLVHESDRPLHCKFLGKINGTSRSSDEKEARLGAENDLRNHAADLKANFAFAEVERTSRVGTSTQQDAFAGGSALLCETEAMEDAKEKSDEKAREQKEKDEADEKQKEADEKKANKENKDKKSKKSKKPAT